MEANASTASLLAMPRGKKNKIPKIRYHFLMICPLGKVAVRLSTSIAKRNVSGLGLPVGKMVLTYAILNGQTVDF